MNTESDFEKEIAKLNQKIEFLELARQDA